VDEINIDGIAFTKYGMLYIEEFELGVIADLHLGYEDVMATKGLFLPKIQKELILRRLDDIYTHYAPSNLLINGDFKHEFSKNMPQEWKEIEEVLDYITSMSKVIVVRGNHDNFLKSILKRRGLNLHDNYKIGDFYFVHGHKDFDIKGITVIGHEHPSVTLRDEIFATLKIPCFLYTPDLIVLPAMSIYAAGTDITRTDYISPILIKNRRDFEVFAVDLDVGVLPAGKLSSLLIHSGDY